MFFAGAKFTHMACGVCRGNAVLERMVIKKKKKKKPTLIWYTTRHMPPIKQVKAEHLWYLPFFKRKKLTFVVFQKNISLPTLQVASCQHSSLASPFMSNKTGRFCMLTIPTNQELKACTVCGCVCVCVGGGDQWAHLLASEHLLSA